MYGSQKNKVEANSTENAEQISDDWTRLPNWICCMCVVTFDLNLGQALEFVYPLKYRPSETEVSNICYMAFPDSNSGCMGDTKFHMRLRKVSDRDQRLETEVISKTICLFNRDCIPSAREDRSHFWGFVYFRQKKDGNLPRGYFQKSFIIITRMPFFNLFYEIVANVAPKFFEEGTSVLKNACMQIEKNWPDLQAGVLMNLPLFDVTYQVFIPRLSSRKSNSVNTEKQISPDRRKIKTLSSVIDLDLFQSLEFVVENLYLLWELVLTAEPIVVVGTSPADCSQMVQILTALIAPLEYFGESRPFFTIHDTEFKEFTREYGKKPPPVILGVTNPFFVKLLKDWPHIIRLSDMQRGFTTCNSVTSYSSGGFLNKGLSCQHSLSTASTSLNLSSDGTVPGLHTKYKPFLKKDKVFIKKILLGIKTKRPDHIQTALLRRHLLELTQSFIIPLERYVASLMPLQKDISPFKSTPNANTFKLEDFLATLELSGPQLTSPLKGDWRGLYQRFFHSSNFRGWYELRHRELQLTLQDLQLHALSQTNLQHWAQDKQEVEIIDMILKLKQKLNLYSEKSLNDVGAQWANVAPRNQIQTQIDCLKELLPNDLKNFVNI